MTMPELPFGSWEADHTITRAQHDRMLAIKGRPLTDIVRSYIPRPNSIDPASWWTEQLRSAA